MMATTIITDQGVQITYDDNTVTLTLPRDMASNLRDLLDHTDLKEYAQNPGSMGVSDETGTAIADAGYALLHALALAL